MPECRICSRDTREPWNQPLLESDQFVVVPSLGSLVEGWVLIVPKQHVLSNGALPVRLVREMDELKQFVCDVLRQKYGRLCVFEHGPSKTGLRIGCGVDHAHLHIVPLSFDLSLAVEPFLPPKSEWRKATCADCRSAVRDGDDYLYLEPPRGNALIARHRGFESQVFRRAIASELGVPAEYDWRNHPHLENVNKTIQFFRQQITHTFEVVNESADAA